MVHPPVRPVPTFSPIEGSVWETLGPISLGLLGSLAIGATAYLIYRRWARRVAGTSGKLFVFNLKVKYLPNLPDAYMTILMKDVQGTVV